MAGTDIFFRDVEMVIASFTEADVPRIQQMLSELDQIATDLPKTAARCHSYRARLFSKLGQHGDALAAINRAINLAPKDHSLLISRGRINANGGRHAQAIADFDRALAAEPDSAQALVHRGNTYKSMGDVARARADYLAALNLEPGSQPIKEKLKELGDA
ncbi:MAG: tetratricopeptide repeat protein [Chloroflexi bacterium]|nr:tetratricopeptide repeat protein [Chloroflexota bacterium]